MPPDVARLAALTTHTSDVVLMLNPAGEVEWAGPSMRQLLGFDDAALEGATAARFIASEDIEGWRAFLGDLRGRPGASLFTRLHCRHQDGSARWVHVTGQNLLNQPSVRALVVR